MAILQGKAEEDPAQGYPGNVKGWKMKFFISGGNWEFPKGLSRGSKDPKVMEHPRSVFISKLVLELSKCSTSSLINKCSFILKQMLQQVAHPDRP